MFYVDSHIDRIYRYERPTLPMAPLKASKRGFTLIEILITLTILASLIGGVFSLYATSVENARVQKMRANLTLIKQAIEQYYAINGKYPTSLEILTRRYLSKLPDDPLTDYRGNDWLVIGPDGNPLDPNSWRRAANDCPPTGIFDVRSSSGH